MSSYSKFGSAFQAEVLSDVAAPEQQTQPPPSPALPPEHHAKRRRKPTSGLVEQKSLWNDDIIRQAFLDAFRKLNPAGWSRIRSCLSWKWAAY
jgi:hypothetical protein